MSKPAECVEIITGRERRRRYSALEKVRLVEQTLQLSITVSAVARLHGVSLSLLFQCRRHGRGVGHEAVSADQEVVPINRVPELEAKVHELEGLLGRKTMETEILCEVLEHARSETQVALAVPTTGRFLFRLMRYASLLLQLHTGRWPTRTPQGIVVVPASNRCWALNGLESPCWKSEVVRFAFVIDTHDHEIITLVAISSGSISGEMILDLMLDCIECRFDAIRTPQPVNGSPPVAFPTPLLRRPTSPPRSTSSCASRRFAAPKATASAKPSSNLSSATMLE